MILINYITFDVYDKLGNNLEIEKRNLAYEQQIALCNKQAAERETSYQETRRIRHDLKDYLIDLKVTLKNRNLNDALKKLIICWSRTSFIKMRCHAVEIW